MTTDRRPHLAKGKSRARRLAIVELEIVGLAKGGDGIGHTDIDGRPCTVLVAQTAPGDLVRASAEKSGSVYRGQLTTILRASASRIVPPCVHAERCGGCDLMHMTLSAQRAARTTVIAEALAHAGAGLVEVQSHDASATEGIRTRARLAVRARAGQVVVGFRAARSHDLVRVDRCLVLSPVLDEARAELEPWLAGAEGQGEVTISQGAEARPAVHLGWSGSLLPSVFATAEKHVHAGRWAGAQIALDGARQPAVIGDPRPRLTGLDGLPVVSPAGGFMQAFEAMNATMARTVVERARVEGRRTLELFSGSGNFTIGLARATDALETVESSSDAVDAAQANLAARGLRARVRCGDADAWPIHDDVRVVVLDPPRAGAPGASARIAASRVRWVVMVSCDPATLGRDVGTLRRDGGFAVRSAEVFEMFPHTSHVETLVVLERERTKRS